MEIITSLSTIKKILSTQTAIQYAESRLKDEQENYFLTTFNSSSGNFEEVKVDYYEYMRQTWHWEEKPPLQDCVEASRVSKLKEYAGMVERYYGWIKNGKLFVLNKKEKFVSFLYEVKKDGMFQAKPTTAMLYTHYNPLDVDCIEEAVNHSYLFDGIMSDTYDISVYEGEMIKACDLLINEKIV